MAAVERVAAVAAAAAPEFGSLPREYVQRQLTLVQVRAYGGPQLQLTQKVLTRFSEAVEKSGVDVVPRIVVGGA